MISGMILSVVWGCIAEVNELLPLPNQQKWGNAFMHYYKVIVSDRAPANHFHAKEIRDPIILSLQQTPDATGL